MARGEGIFLRFWMFLLLFLFLYTFHRQTTSKQARTNRLPSPSPFSFRFFHDFWEFFLSLSLSSGETRRELAKRHGYLDYEGF